MVGGARRSIGAAAGGAEVWLPLGAALGAGPPGATRGVGAAGGGAVGGVGAAVGGGVGGAGGWPVRVGGCVRSRSSSRSRSCCCMAGPPAGGLGAAGAGAAAGGGTCGGAGGGGAAGCGGGGGAAGCGGGGGGGGACRGGGGGGAGRAGGAAFGASLGLGFPSGPTSSLACATTMGADCACDGVVANCMAVKAVVASSASRKVIMTAWILMGNSWKERRGGGFWRKILGATGQKALRSADLGSVDLGSTNKR